MHKIPLFKAYLPEKAFEDVKKVLESGYLTVGPETRTFETKVKGFLKYEDVSTVILYITDLVESRTSIELKKCV